ncbi:MAG: NADH:ubiquinone oxidoreductase [Deltaproteobacteria bacterium]|nr:NADH:ubiquinone oxidoreductase [Deltaproteobacteria bacterium]
MATGRIQQPQQTEERAPNLFWLQCGACSGDSMSLLGVDDPDLGELVRDVGLEILWHPSASRTTPGEFQEMVDLLVSGRKPLDILCIEGAIIRGPGGTGMFDTFAGSPKKDLAVALARKAQFVVAVGTCAGFGGIPASGETEATGLQFHGRTRGGVLGNKFTARSGLPVINLPGCPCGPEIVGGALAALLRGEALPLNEYQMPLEWYGVLVHQGCTRNEYHEFRVEDQRFGQPGCLFYHLGCQGPMTYGSCNKLLWSGRTSRTRVGVPCVGCKDPDFPKPHPFFRTRNIEGLPVDLPVGVDRAHFLAYKTMAEAVAPERLKERKQPV